MNWNKIFLFLILTFGISWLSALYLYSLDIEFGSVGYLLFVAIFYMPAPAFASLIVQKLIYKEPLSNIGWSFSKRTIQYSLLAAFLGALLVTGTLMVSFLFGNGIGISSFGIVDLSEKGVMNAIAGLIEELPAGQESTIEKYLDEGLPFPVLLVLPFTLIVGLISAFTFNLPFMFGEEFGWRGLLLYESRDLGLWKNTLFIGVIWGLWHAPIIIMGHNYPDYPIMGIFMMCAFTITLSIPFAYVRIKSESILAPCILHGMINSTVGATILFLSGGHTLVGSVAGVSGIIAFGTLSAVIVLVDPKFFRSYSQT